MKIRLSKPFASNGKADEFDVHQIKKALNRLGYYMPYQKTGITGIPDKDVFEALKEFQKESGLRANGEARPSDETIEMLNREIAKTPEGYYIWRTVEDCKVRAAHAQYNRTVRAWNDSPDPGDDFNCRCWAEPVADENIYPDAINPVYPELILLSFLKIGRPSIILAVKILGKIDKKILRQKNARLTEHGNIRFSQTGITQKEIEDAIETAKTIKNTTIKIGKYGTRQIHYKGANGITVIVETTGRNANKIITLYRH